LAEAMQARGLSGGELARRTGFTSQYVNSLRNKGRGGRLPLDTARRLAHALAVSVEWLTNGTGPRERLSDVYPVYREPEAALSDRYPSRAETIALLETTVAREVIAALRASQPEVPETDPGRDYWIARARELVRDLQRIRVDPELNRGALEPPKGPPESGWQKSPLLDAATPVKRTPSPQKKK
jgi:transcriptional regulator with XRE-family HTH domain